MRSTIKLSIIAVMTATCVASNYLLIGVVNVKVMDLIVFACGLSFGAVIGAMVGALTWLVYGTINPYGFSLPILAATCLLETIYGLTGAGMRKLGFAKQEKSKKHFISESLKFAIIGFLLTAVYDLATNLVSALSLGLPILTVMLTGIPFAIIHEASNAAFFFVGALPLQHVLRRILVPKSDQANQK